MVVEPIKNLKVWAKHIDYVAHRAFRLSEPFYVELFNELTVLKDGFIELKKCYAEK